MFVWLGSVTVATVAGSQTHHRLRFALRPRTESDGLRNAADDQLRVPGGVLCGCVQAVYRNGTTIVM